MDRYRHYSFWSWYLFLAYIDLLCAQNLFLQQNMYICLVLYLRPEWAQRFSPGCSAQRVTPGVTPGRNDSHKQRPEWAQQLIGKNISFIIFNSIGVQKLFIFLPKCFNSVVFRLIPDIFYGFSNNRRTH